MPLQLVTINLPMPYVKTLDKMVDSGLYPSRSQLIRVCINAFLPTEEFFLIHLNKEERT